MSANANPPKPNPMSKGKAALQSVAGAMKSAKAMQKPNNLSLDRGKERFFFFDFKNCFSLLKT